MQSKKLLPLLDAIEQETGHRPHPSTAMRWCLKPNKHGNVLESWMIGGRRMTSIEAVRRYNVTVHRDHSTWWVDGYFLRRRRRARRTRLRSAACRRSSCR
ncbi:DUF1580 domain-containing protein [Rhodopirellula sp. P2]|uniref:DUF1580 domain-containing protein n=1 Tax=Rhodopirellula sp. P2 TaxID=2127060 RepID=UPI0023682CBB|nr:DUF1580 domain-containing protein [Rhodopirellula sp. P2]WDQ17338.1 DUF1580 domain-containing protein [Rhodopirellula sp. P2]